MSQAESPRKEACGGLKACETATWRSVDARPHGGAGQPPKLAAGTEACSP
jgi:hypothetical protein